MSSKKKLIIVILTNAKKVKYGKLPAEVVEEILQNKLLVDLIYPIYIIDPIDIKNTYIIINIERNNINA